MNFFNFQTIVENINVTLLESLLSPYSMLINDWLRQQEAEFSIKAPTTTNLQHWIGRERGNGNIKSRFFVVTLGFVQDCRNSAIFKMDLFTTIGNNRAVCCCSSSVIFTDKIKIGWKWPYHECSIRSTFLFCRQVLICFVENANYFLFD